MRILPFALALLLLLLAPPAFARAAPGDPSPREAMRSLVIDLSRYAKERHPGFLLLPLNAEELVRDLPRSSAPHEGYLSAIDGVFVESLHFAPVDRPRDPAGSRRRLELLYAAKKRDLPLFVIDYVRDPKNLATARRRAAREGTALFPADRRELDSIPAALGGDGTRRAKSGRSAAKTGEFLYLVNPGRFDGGSGLSRAVAKCAADLVVVDPWVDRGVPLDPRHVERMKRGPGGARRPVIAYLSVGEAELYRDYWNPEWAAQPPAWIVGPNPDWPHCFIVRYWAKEWRAILFGTRDSALDRILAQGFDGVALDTVDTFYRFEKN